MLPRAVLPRAVLPLARPLAAPALLVPVMAALPGAMIVVVAGVSGSGKSTIGQALADRLSWVFADGDSMHPASNIAKMANGIPLTDSDRLPWLNAITAWVDGQIAVAQPSVIACSALKRSYRDLLVGGRPTARIAFLEIDRDVAASRLTARHGHFFDPALLASQFADLEQPTAAELAVVTVPVLGPPDDIVTEVIQSIGLDSPDLSRSGSDQAQAPDGSLDST